MEFSEQLIPGAVQWVAGAGYLALLLLALRLANWRRLLDREQWHVFLGSCVVLALLWSVRADINPQLSFHLLGVTAVTLMTGWAFAAIASSVALVIVTLNAGTGWDAFFVNAFVLGLVPVTLTQLLLVLVFSYLPRNFFVYVLVNAFLAGGLVALVSGYLAVALLVAQGGHTFGELNQTLIPFFPLMFLPEAFLNGWIITILVLYKPTWVSSFSDRHYLEGK